MNLQRLSTLSNHLRNNVNPLRFEYADWFHCAVGHATEIPEFQAAGFTFDSWRENNGPLIAARHFFGLTLEQAGELFLTGYPGGGSPGMAADRIDAMIAKEVAARAAADVAAVTRPDMSVFERVDVSPVPGEI